VKNIPNTTSSFVLHSIFQMKLNMKHSICCKVIWVLILKCTSNILEASAVPVVGYMCEILRATQYCFHEHSGSNRIWQADAITKGLNPALSRMGSGHKIWQTRSQLASDTCNQLNTGYMCNVAVVQYELWKCTYEMWNMKMYY